ncbi:hypothetical protein NMG60_11033574 [Bertholletia excelsa]
MDSLLGFNETVGAADGAVDKSSGCRLVPWLSWEEWDSVRESLFSSCPHSVSSALQRITAWRSRGCIPVVIEVTASIIEIQQKDPHFGADDASSSEEMLAMLYCMAIVRLVNGVIEKMRKKNELSIAEAADAINIPRMLIDIRHEGSHRDLPSLQLVRLASIKAIDWLKSYYWEPQKNAIPFKGDRMASLRKEIKSRLCELSFCTKIKKAAGSSFSIAKGKRIKHLEQLCRRNKFLSLMGSKPQYSKSAGPKKRINKVLKHLVRLYSSHSSEVGSVLVELLLKGSDLLDFIELPKDYLVTPCTDNGQSAFDDWKPVITKLSNKQPEFLLTLCTAVLEMIETQESMSYESGEHAQLENAAKVHHIEQLSNLFEWLVRNLKGLKLIGGKYHEAVTDCSSTDINLLTATHSELLRRSLLVSCPGNNHLKRAALVLAHMIGNSSQIEKLEKFCSLDASDFTIGEENFLDSCSESTFAQQERYIKQAAEMLELVKLQRRKSDVLLKTRDDGMGNYRWSVAKSWKSCPIGMLPCDVGSSGRLPDLDCENDPGVVKPPPSEINKTRALKEGSLKRGSDCYVDVELLNNNLHSKRMKMSESPCESDGKDNKPSEGVRGQLLIGGVWKKVEQEELLAITSAVRILV